MPRWPTGLQEGEHHRHQVLEPAGCAPIVYAGSVERTSFAEAPETKGYVVLELTRSGLGAFEFRPLPARPMVKCALALEGIDAMQAHARVAAAIGATPDDAVVQLRITGATARMPGAAALREMAGMRNVTTFADVRALASPNSTLSDRRFHTRNRE